MRLADQSRCPGDLTCGLSVAALLLACACAGPPAVSLLPAVEADPLVRSCLAHFPSGSFAVVHAIEATLPFGKASSVLGVSSWDEESRTLSAALLAPEGIALFEASRTGGGNVVVTRALPPLDRPGFAEGLFEDLELIYFPPGAGPGLPPAVALRPVPGRYDDGRTVCRWSIADRVVDLLPADDGGFLLLEYREGAKPSRRFEARAPDPGDFPLSARLEKAGAAGYSMQFTLVEQ